MKNWKSVSMVFGGRRLEVWPFAGVYPTRWRIEISYAHSVRAKRKTFKYVGKPNRNIASVVGRILRSSAVGNIRAEEFDRAGVIAYADTVLPRSNPQVADWTLAYRFYYPFDSNDATMITPWRDRTFHRLPIVFQGRKCIVYSRHIPEELGEENWRTHKTWLSGAGLQLGKPQSISTS